MSTPPREVYLAPGFDGTKLKVPQLRSVLLEHGVYFPSSAKKADLVALFQTQVQSRAAEILAKDAKVRPSAQGIIAVSSATGDEKPVVPVAGVKRARGRPKKVVPKDEDVEMADEEKPEPEAEAEPAEPAPAPKKRARRITAEPEAGAATPRKPRKSAAAKREEAKREPSPEPAPAPVQTPAPRPIIKPAAQSVRKPAPAAAAASPPTPVRKPRISIDDKDDSSGFSDFNPFQAGSTHAAHAERRRRKSSLGLDERRPRKPRPSEWTATSIPTDLPTPPAAPAARTQLQNVTPSKVQRFPVSPVDQEMDLYTAAEEEYRHKAARRAQLFKTLKGLAVAAVFLFPFVLYYKSVAASNGFCDAGRTTNDVIEGREQPIARAQSCLVRRAEWKLDNDTEPPFQCDASVLPLFSFFPRSTSCTPCPDAAICAHGEVTRCVSDKDILTPHLLAPLGPLVDGWPFLPTRVFAPHCRRDMARMRRVGGLAVEIEAELARARGEAICHGTNYTGDAEGALCDSFATRRVATISRDQFNELFDAALQYLVENGDVEKTTAADDEPTLTTDTDRYTATRIEYSLACSIQLKVQSLLGRAGVTVLNLLARFRWHLIALGATLLAVTWGKYKHKRERSDDEQAKDVRNLALRMLETQEMRHYTDPVTTPHPFIRPAQVRDILLSEKSPSARKRIWARVETQVEQNANVRVAEREVDGDSWKTWEWIGPTRRKGDD